MPSLETGIHFIDAATYHADPCREPSLSSTIARILINQSPLHAWTACPRLNPNHAPVEKKTFDIGRAAHRQVLGVGEDWCLVPSDLLSANGAASTKAAKEFVAEARERGLTPIKEDEAEAVEHMAEAVRTHMRALGIKFDRYRSEVTAIAEIDGAWCRAMIDHAPEDPQEPLYDLKTTTDASPEAVIRAAETYGYDVQAAHYLDVWEAATGERRKFRFVFVEKTPPHACCVVELHDDPDDPADWMLDARSKTADARRIWRECLAVGEWPGYPAAIAVIGARAFYRERWAGRAVGDPIQFSRKPSNEAVSAARRAQAPEGHPDAWAWT